MNPKALYKAPLLAGLHSYFGLIKSSLSRQNSICTVRPRNKTRLTLILTIISPSTHSSPNMVGVPKSTGKKNAAAYMTFFSDNINRVLYLSKAKDKSMLFLVYFDRYSTNSLTYYPV